MSSSYESGFDSLLRNTDGVRLPSNYPLGEVAQLESELVKVQSGELGNGFDEVRRRAKIIDLQLSIKAARARLHPDDASCDAPRIGAQHTGGPRHMTGKKGRYIG